MLRKSLTLFGIIFICMSLASCINPPNISQVATSNQNSYNTSKTNTGNALLPDSVLQTNINETIESLTPSSHFAQNVSAIVWHGNTLLIGQVQNQALKQRILGNVQQVYGVGKIYNEIVVNSSFNPSVITDISDSRITSQIKSAILFTKGLSSFNYSITTNHGNVYILSTGTPYNTAIVQQIAKQTLGVNSVNVLYSN